MMAAKALELRLEGKSFPDIATELGYSSRQTAHAAVTKALRDITREPAEELIVIELERLDRIWELHYLNACAGDVAALGGCMRIMDRRAKLLGLDAPERKEVTGRDGGPIQQETVTKEQVAEVIESVRDKY